MIQFILGVMVGGGTVILFGKIKNSGIQLRWWEWLVSFLGLTYAVFVIEVIVGFILEGAFQAALVMGVLLGILAVIAAVGLVRFIIRPKIQKIGENNVA